MEARHGRIVHAIAGRMRIKLDREELTAELADDLRAALARAPGVSNVEARSRTGSVIISYDPARIDADELASIIRSAASLDLEAPPETASRVEIGSTSSTARTIKGAFREV